MWLVETKQKNLLSQMWHHVERFHSSVRLKETKKGDILWLET